MKETNIQDELRELRSSLEKRERKNPFSVPDLYFQCLPERALQEVKQREGFIEKLEKSVNNFFQRLFQPRIAIPFAACLVIVAAAVGFLRTPVNENFNLSQQLSEIPTNELESYLNANVEEEDLFAFNGSSYSGASEFIVPENISSEELTDYLINHPDNSISEEEIL